MSAATGLDFRHSNIKNFDDVMPVSAGMKRKSEERLDAAIRREEEEEERLLDAAIHREEEAKREAKCVAKAERDRKCAVEAAAAAAKWKDFFPDGGARTCVRLCKDVGCCRLAFSNGVCSGHGPRCSHVGCDNDVHAKNVCRDHGPRCSHMGCDKNVFARNFCSEHDITKK
jgi:hypothetical protein